MASHRSVVGLKNNVSASQSHENAFSFLEKEVNNLFNINFSELLQKMSEFIPQYQSARDASDKKLVLLSFLFTVLK